jgi:hypothetical protein
MIPLRADVIEAYRTFLGREPENEAAILGQQATHGSTVAMVAALLQSVEYRARDRKCRLAEFTGISPELIALLQSFRIAGAPAHGYVVDFIGTRTDITFASGLAGLNTVVEDLPVPRSFQGSATAWAGVLTAVGEAQPRNRLTVVELGGGWASWAVSSAVAARQRGIRDIHLIAVAGDQARAGLIARHLINNGFNPDEHAIVTLDGEPISDLAAILDRAGMTGAAIDLCHVDLATATGDVIAAGAATLSKRVRHLVITTTSRLTEARLLACLADHGWVHERDEPCALAVPSATRSGGLPDDRIGSADGPDIVRDGVQVWRNTGLDR